ncbi:hypothetical protein AB0O07_26785 [Streptomyces sp. NPDC093085]|uniref:hypothetical protein n=1 Tax=Streptomyces sp. NPDC093085 TaxID=3155068 RepID=UPI00342C7CFE
MGERHTDNSFSGGRADTVIQAGSTGAVIQNATGPVHSGTGDQTIITITGAGATVVNGDQHGGGTTNTFNH